MKSVQYNNIHLLQFRSLSNESLFHFTSTIKGGVSKETYTSLNLSPYAGDDPDAVTENQERIANIMGISVENLYIPYQIHKDNILTIDKLFTQKSDLEKLTLMNGIDALITDQKEIFIGITTADCVPILIFDPKKKVLAAIHAGWKGTVLGIAEKTVKKMIEQYQCIPQNLVVGIGPCISQKVFEVGNEVIEAFIENGFDEKEISYRNPVSGKSHINLELANKILLTKAGIPEQNIEIANICTYSNSEILFSARRQTIHSGRILTGGIIK